MRNVLLGLAVSSALNGPAEVVISGAGARVEGTVISSELQKTARKALQAFWKTAEQAVSASQIVLQLAQQAVKEAGGDVTLAVAKFEAACASAVVDFRQEHKDETGEAKEKLEDFLADSGIWAQYLRNIKGGMKDFPPAVFETFKTESSLRKARKAIKDAKKTRTAMRDKMAAKFDLEDVTDEAFDEAIKTCTNESGTVDEAKLEKALRKAGAVEVEDEEDEDTRIERLASEAKAAAGVFLGDDPRWNVCRESLAKLLVLLARIPDDAGNEDQTNQALNNAFVKIAKTHDLTGGGDLGKIADGIRDTRNTATL
jgi:hypothetical protein